MGTPITSSPSSIVNQGAGIPWSNPSAASGTGIGTNQIVVIIGFSISGNVVTFSTAPQALVAGQPVAVSGLVIGTYLNSQTLTVLSSGLSSTVFEADFTHADVSSTVDSGFAVPTSSYASANNQDVVEVPSGQYAAYCAPLAGTGMAQDFGTCFGETFLGWSCSGQGSYGTVAGALTNGCPFGGAITVGTSGFSIPTLPAGAVVQAIYLYASGSAGSGGSEEVVGSAIRIDAILPSGSVDIDNELAEGGYTSANLGTDLSILSTLGINLTTQATEEVAPEDGGYYRWAAASCTAVVLYTVSGTPTPSTQVQTLAATGFTEFSSIPSTDLITGVQVNLASGMEFGDDTTLSVQITQGGTPVGTPMTQAVSSWSTPYTLGEDGALWGISSDPLPGSDAPTIGVNVNATLSDGSQINLNDWTMTLYVVPQLSLFLLANPTTIEQGASSNLLWVVSGYDSASIDEGIGSVPLSGNTNVSPLITTTYTLTGTGTGIPTGTTTATVDVLSNEAAFALQKLILTLKQDMIPVRGRNGGGS